MVLLSDYRITGHRTSNTVTWCWYHNIFNAKLNNLNFHPLESVSHYRDPQLQVSDNYLDLFNYRPNICKSVYAFKHNKRAIKATWKWLMLGGLKAYKLKNITHNIVIQMKQKELIKNFYHAIGLLKTRFFPNLKREINWLALGDSSEIIKCLIVCTSRSR